MQEQLGWRAVLRSVKENAPYWAEKLPEMPTLLYDYLHGQKQLAQFQRDAMQQLLMHQQQLKQRVVYSIGAAAFIISATLLWNAAQPLWLVASAAVGALLCVFLSNKRG
jgi:ubiquinone biosynthesis protein